jgi:hypothetical protein
MRSVGFGPFDYQWTLEGEEDGVPVKLLITVLDEMRLIDGIMTRVVEEREWEDDELVEVSWNYFAVANAPEKPLTNSHTAGY